METKRMNKERVNRVTLKFRAALLAVSALTGVLMAMPSTAAEPDYRWYVTPSIGAIFSGTGAGPHGSLIVGRSVLPNFAIEGEFGYGVQAVTNLPKGNDYQRLVLGVNALGYFSDASSKLRPYGLVNLNGHAIDFLGESLSGVGISLGGGVFVNLSPRVDLRLESRYNLDFVSQKGTVPDSKFNTGTVTAGVRFKFGHDPDDADGDGVPNGSDKCPNTPRGVQVYSDGCPVDIDGDGVPDYLDKCPGTPKGVVVNRDGCPADSDGDGVVDELDKCPGTPKGVAVNRDGCALDSDGDGVPDYLDQCPNTPKGAKVDARGCAFLDKDGDGVPDYIDKCPDTPKGVPVDESGCALDSDGDGIPDYLDECPHTPPGLKVLPNGCALKGDCRRPRPGEPVDKNGCALDKRFILRGVKFEFDSDRLTEPSKLILNEVALTLKSYDTVYVDVEGHTDAIGIDTYNQPLSERRAITVKRYLADHGVKPDHMRPVGYGEAVPIDDNSTDAGRENNRRVEFKVTKE